MLRRTLRMVLPMAVVLALFLQGPASAATKNVSIVDNGYSPATSNVKVGDAVLWTWTGANPHSSSSDSTMPYTWDSTVKTSGTFSQGFTFAGGFAYHCNVHSSMHGTVSVAPKISPTSGMAGKKFTITFATVTLTGTSLQAIIEMRAPGAPGFVPFKTVSTGTTTRWNSTGATAGTYQFRVTLRDTSTGKTSAAGKAAKVTVT